MQLMHSFLRMIFNGLIPKIFGETVFAKKLLDYIVLQKAISNSKFIQDYVQSGVPFNNNFALVKSGVDKILPLDYGPEVFVETSLIKYNYVAPKFEGSTIMVSESTKDFLEVVCEGDIYKYCVIRGFFRNIITAKEDGVNWQSALWVWGPGGTGKSLLVELAKAMVGSNYVTEFSRHQNQFTSSQLVGTKLLVVSDLEFLNNNQLLKRLLGRDTFETKHVAGIESFTPYCQVIFASNQPPTALRKLLEDQAILDKLIILEYTTESQIPAKQIYVNI